MSVKRAILLVHNLVNTLWPPPQLYSNCSRGSAVFSNIGVKNHCVKKCYNEDRKELMHSIEQDYSDKETILDQASTLYLKGI